MANLNDFDARHVEMASDFEPLPAGQYTAVIMDSQFKPTKTGDGQYLELKLQVLDGPYKGRLVWDRLCLTHPNALTAKIARSRLAAICRAVNVLTPRDSVELHNLPLVVKVVLTRRKDSGDLANEVKGYACKPAVAAAPISACSTPPWKRSAV